MLQNTMDIIAYEEGTLSDDEVVDLFQRLINTGLAWTLQGSYGRQAMAFIEAGLCVLPDSDKRD